MTRLLARLERIEVWLDPRPDNLEPQLIFIRGGIDGDTLRAQIGARWLEPRLLESERDFYDRCLDLAQALGEPFCVVGGLPP